jgi:hypothetical protein
MIVFALLAFLFLRAPPDPVALAGDWSADVAYDWGDKYTDASLSKWTATW